MAEFGLLGLARDKNDFAGVFMICGEVRYEGKSVARAASLVSFREVSQRNRPWSLHVRKFELGQVSLYDQVRRDQYLTSFTSGRLPSSQRGKQRDRAELSPVNCAADSLAYAVNSLLSNK